MQNDPYDAMYLKLFNTATDMIFQLSEMTERLRTVQQECEEMLLVAADQRRAELDAAPKVIELFNTEAYPNDIRQTHE